MLLFHVFLFVLGGILDGRIVWTGPKCCYLISLNKFFEVFWAEGRIQTTNCYFICFTICLKVFWADGSSGRNQNAFLSLDYLIGF